eukprot:1156982-Pelagomonas_calceolata.AAC.3
MACMRASTPTHKTHTHTHSERTLSANFDAATLTLGRKEANKILFGASLALFGSTQLSLLNPRNQASSVRPMLWCPAAAASLRRSLSAEQCRTVRKAGMPEYEAVLKPMVPPTV